MKPRKAVSRVETKFELWSDVAASGDYQAALHAADLAVRECKMVLAEHSLPPESHLAKLAYVTAIAFQGLKELADLLILTQGDSWYEDHPRVQRCWDLYCNASDRLRFVSRYLPGPTVEWALRRCQAFETGMHDLFGSGLYFSPEIRSKRSVCSICGQDYRACDHVRGHLYSGQRCATKNDDPVVTSVSIVEAPADMRCRIWPWHMDDKTRTLKGCVLTTFAVDDFLYSEDAEPDTGVT